MGLYALLSLFALLGLLVTLNSRLTIQESLQHQQDVLRTLHSIRSEIAEVEDPQELISVWQQSLFRSRQQLWLMDANGQLLTQPFGHPPSGAALQSLLKSSLEFGQSLQHVRFEENDAEVLAVAINASPDSEQHQVLLLLTDPEAARASSSAIMSAVRRATVFTWLLGVLCVAFVVAGLVSPLQMMSRNLDETLDRTQRHDMLLRISDRHDELGEVAASLYQLQEVHRLAVADLQLTERELRSSVELLSTVLDSMIEGVVAIDSEQRIVFLNAGARRLLGMSDVIGPGHRLYESVRVPAFLDTVAETLSSREMQTVEYRTARDHSDLVLVVIPILEGPHAAAVAVVRDISEMRRLEAMRRDFVSGVSHELKTPLTVIQACTDTLLGGALSDPTAAERFLRQIEEQSERLLQLILGMLQLARVESGQQVLHIEPVPVHLLAEDVIRSFRTVADTRSIRLSLTGAEELTVTSDEQALHTILSNLIDNALKHTPAGGSITVELIANANAHGLMVRDTGSGIPEELLDRIFERFYRVDRDRSRERGGTGLGLAIVKHLCQAIGASVSVKSQLGKGSQFIVNFHAGSATRSRE